MRVYLRMIFLLGITSLLLSILPRLVQPQQLAADSAAGATETRFSLTDGGVSPSFMHAAQDAPRSLRSEFADLTATLTSPVTLLASGNITAQLDVLDYAALVTGRPAGRLPGNSRSFARMSPLEIDWSGQRSAGTPRAPDPGTRGTFSIDDVTSHYYALRISLKYHIR